MGDGDGATKDAEELDHGHGIMWMMGSLKRWVHMLNSNIRVSPKCPFNGRSYVNTTALTFVGQSTRVEMSLCGVVGRRFWKLDWGFPWFIDNPTSLQKEAEARREQSSEHEVEGIRCRLAYRRRRLVYEVFYPGSKILMSQLECISRRCRDAQTCQVWCTESLI